MTTTDLTALARQINEAGWTYRAAHEPGDYDRCDQCREACDDLAAFIAPLIAREKAEAWDEGFRDGRRQEGEGDDGPRYVNPYRQEADRGE